MKHVNLYLLKAMDYYPCNMEEAIQSIQYALSYNDQNPHTLLLAGRMYAEIFQDQGEAIKYYEDALAADMDAVKVYPYLIDAYLETGEFEKAERLIDFAMKIKAVEKSIIVSKKIKWLEMQGEFAKASKLLDLLRLELYDNDWKSWLEETEARLKSKKEITKKWKKKLSM